MKRHTNISEEDLIDLLNRQDKKAIDILYNNYSDALYGFIYRVVQDDELAEDLLQDAFVKIWKNFSQYDPSKGRLFTWLVNVARNLAIDKIRSKDFSNSAKNQSIDGLVSYIDLNAGHSYNPDVIGIKEMVGRLTPDQSKIIDLLYYQGYTQVEVAEELNIPLGTVKTRARLAISQLRKEFDKVNTEL